MKDFLFLFFFLPCFLTVDSFFFIFAKSKWIMLIIYELRGDFNGDNRSRMKRDRKRLGENDLVISQPDTVYHKKEMRIGHKKKYKEREKGTVEKDT